MLYTSLNPEKALIWRIVHRDNLPWILDNGLYCGHSSVKAPSWVSIGNPELICRIPSDHIPIRSWPLFLARDLMRDLIETLKAEQST